MFPFSSFASNIPLFVLTFAYMLYFGTYAFNKTKTDNFTDIIQEKEQIVKCSSKEYGSNTFNYYQSSNENQATYSEVVQVDIFPEQFTYSIKYIPEKKISIHFYGSSLFSRPPPFLA